MKRFVCSCVLSASIGIPLVANSDLLEALRVNDEKAVASLLANGGDANSRSQQGVTALMQAALHASPQLMKFLLDHGADPNAHKALVHWAARRGPRTSQCSRNCWPRGLASRSGPIVAVPIAD